MLTLVVYIGPERSDGPIYTTSVYYLYICMYVCMYVYIHIHTVYYMCSSEVCGVLGFVYAFSRALYAQAGGKIGSPLIYYSIVYSTILQCITVYHIIRCFLTLYCIILYHIIPCYIVYHIIIISPYLSAQRCRHRRRLSGLAPCATFERSEPSALGVDLRA